jgi:hypothetical protein
MGFVSWLGAGVIAAVVSRFIPAGERRSFVAELVVALLLASAAGLAATALDFGGWSELEPRAIAFAALVAFAGIGAMRLSRR